jgi:hypothetical protein
VACAEWPPLPGRGLRGPPASTGRGQRHRRLASRSVVAAGWQWTVLLPAVQRGVAAGGCTTLPLSTSRVHCPSVRTVDVRRLRRPGPDPSRCPRNRTPRQYPLDARDCGQVLAGPPLSAADTAAASLTRGMRSPAADRPCTPRRLQRWTPAAYSVYRGSTSSTRAAVQTRVSPHGVPPQPADTVAMSAVCPELPPPGDAVRTAGVHRGHHGSAGSYRAAAELDGRTVSAVRCCSGTAAGFRTAVSTADTADSQRYRKRSPGRRLDGCRYCR